MGLAVLSTIPAHPTCHAILQASRCTNPFQNRRWWPATGDALALFKRPVARQQRLARSSSGALFTRIVKTETNTLVTNVVFLFRDFTRLFERGNPQADLHGLWTTRPKDLWLTLHAPCSRVLMAPVLLQKRYCQRKCDA